jgi:mannitol operon transcriptional antiterminator
MPSLPITINARQRNIIYALLKGEGHLTYAALARQTQLSVRVVRYNLSAIKQWFRLAGVKLQTRPGYGIEIDAPKQLRKQLLYQILELDDYDLILTREQRMRVILAHLLSTYRPIAMQDLANTENISRSTLFKDIRGIQDWLAQFNLSLKRQTHKGCWVEGMEASRRFALGCIIREELGENKWYKLWSENSSASYLDKSIPVRIETFINSLELDFCHRMIEKIEHSLGREMSIKSRVELQVYLALALDALMKGRKVQVVHNLDVLQSIEYDVAKVVAAEIQKKYALDFPSEEAELVAAYLLGSKWTASESNISSEQASRNMQAGLSVRLAERMALACSVNLHPLLQHDQELIKGLANHLESSIYRLEYGLPIRNPYLSSIRELYPEIYRSAERGKRVIEGELKVSLPPEEVGFLAMYLAAALERLRTVKSLRRPVALVTEGVRATPALLKARLEYEFPNLDIVQVYSNLDWQTSLESTLDLAISTIQLDHPTLPVIQVSPFLSKGDVDTIQNWLVETENRERRTNLAMTEKYSLIDLLELNNILFHEKASNWQEVVLLASRPLLHVSHIEKRYINAMVDVILEHGPYMALAPGVLLLHAKPTDGVNALCLSLLMLEQGILFGESAAHPIDIVFVLGAVDNHAHLTALFQLSDLLQTPTFLHDLRNSKTPFDVLRTVWRYIPTIQND